MYNSPIFIIANPRSGSSVFRILLNHSDDAVFPPECGFIQWLYPTYKKWDTSLIDRFIKDVLSSKKAEGWKLSEVHLSTFMHYRNPQTYAEACAVVYEFYGKMQGKDVKIWGDKNNYYIDHLELLNEIYPDAKYIWLKRNPMDVTRSYLKINELDPDLKYIPKFPKEIRDILQQIKNNYSKIESFLETIDTEKYLSINFEDILLDKQDVYNSLENFTGINIKKALEKFNSNVYLDEPSDMLVWKSKVKDSLDKSYLNVYQLHPKAGEIEKEYKRIFKD